VNWRKVLFFFVLAAMATAAGLEAWSWRGWLLANKGLYLTHNERWEEAERVLRSAEAAGESERAQYLRARVELNAGRPAEALRRLDGLPRRPAVAVDRGIALYLLGETTAALAAFRDAASAAQTATDGLASLAVAALDTDGQRRLAAPEPVDGQLVDRLVWHAMAGRLALREGRYRPAAQALERAIELGDTNPETIFLATVACALASDYSRAEYLAGSRMAQPMFRARLTSYFDRLTSATGEPAFSVTDLGSVSARQLEAARAAAWVCMRGALLDRDTTGMMMALRRLDTLLADWPRDLLLRSWRAQMLSALGQDRDAFLAYAELHDLQPTYAILLRLLDLAGPDEQLLSKVDKMLSAPTVAAVVPWHDFRSTVALRRESLLAFLEEGSAEATVTVAEAGEYALLTVGRADPASGVWPRVDVDINGAHAGYIVIAGEEWDVFSIRAPLRAGDNRIKLFYANDREPQPVAGEDRNFYLRQIIIGRTDFPSGN
jgi:tetratricopeptide (TPR) repeat protein